MPVCETLTMHVRFVIAVVGLGVAFGVTPGLLLCLCAFESVQCLNKWHVLAKHKQGMPNSSNTVKKAFFVKMPLAMTFVSDVYS